MLQPLFFYRTIHNQLIAHHCRCRQVNVRFKHLVARKVNQECTMIPNALRFKCRPISMNNTEPFGIYWTQVLIISQARQSYRSEHFISHMKQSLINNTPISILKRENFILYNLIKRSCPTNKLSAGPRHPIYILHDEPDIFQFFVTAISIQVIH